MDERDTAMVRAGDLVDELIASRPECRDRRQVAGQTLTCLDRVTEPVRIGAFCASCMETRNLVEARKSLRGARNFHGRAVAEAARPGTT